MPKLYKIGKFLCQESTEEEYYEEVKERELSFKREIELSQKQKELRENGNFSEADKLENFTLDEWLEWKEKEKQRIESLEHAVERKLEK